MPSSTATTTVKPPIRYGKNRGPTVLVEPGMVIRLPPMIR